MLPEEKVKEEASKYLSNMYSKHDNNCLGNMEYKD